ncbi:hypothetical protein ACFSJY_12190 [Thalassotalea euphylliae]|uniref:hypothetical protein n=1 Tax=Thalassotalea euphylliae TaxID=1655234 RepID=UPI003635BF41
MRLLTVPFIALLINACTSGELVYFDGEGKRKTACQTEYSWAPSVDKYAVEYILVHCAKQAVAKGYKIEDETLLKVDIAIPSPPANKVWTFELATALHEDGKLTDKEYGYVIAHIDLNAA